MNNSTEARGFIEAVRSNYDGRATLEIEMNKVVVVSGTLRPASFEAWAKLLIGTPKKIGDQLLYPVELPVLATFDASRDGEMSWEEALRVTLGRALEHTCGGSSVLLKGESECFEHIRVARRQESLVSRSAGRMTSLGSWLESWARS